jgi:hypothetical protein
LLQNPLFSIKKEPLDDAIRLSWMMP